MHYRKLFFAVVGLLFVCSLAYAEIPKMINFQGRLTDAGGKFVPDGNYSLIFRIYSDSTGGTDKWTEEQIIAVSKGLFNAILGSITPIPDSIFNYLDTWLGIQVGADPEMSPRQRLSSVAYSYRSATGAGDNDWTINGDTIYHLNGNVGIGTTNPGYKLDVSGDIRTSGNLRFGSGSTPNIAGNWWEFGFDDGVSGTGIDFHGGSTLTDYTARIYRVAGDNGNWQFVQQGTGAIRMGTSNSDDDLVILSNGNVGIGTTAPNEQLEITGNLRLPASTASAGVIKSGANRFIHNFGTSNFFAGVNAGNFTLSGSGGNTGVGVSALQALTTGYFNTAVGTDALRFNSTGYYNTAVGQRALFYNTTGYSNTAVGPSTLISNTTGNSNTAMGQNALFWNSTGYSNTAMGLDALGSNTTGGSNTAMGRNALTTNTTGGGNTAIGYLADVWTGGLTNATAIGWGATVDASNKVRIGNTWVTSIGGAVGWSVFSDGRLKTNVRKSPLGLDFILKLNPITYNSLAQGQEGITYTGLIAQEVEKVLQELGADFSGLDKPKNKDGFYQLRYAEFVMPLIKAMQELNARNEKLEARLAELEALVKSLAANPSTPNQFDSYEAGAGVTK
ncbi:MAG: tail fiber domain-containing protein [candidate division Zixibacteria bacterium]|nr:tail fiber domain-containing protein [candidate division Zixibacteria bacterium]